jgi:hypothetical protein
MKWIGYAVKHNPSKILFPQGEARQYLTAEPVKSKITN